MGGEDIKKYHIKLGLDCDEISVKHRFDEIAYYSMYHNFGYGPKTSAAIYENSIILILEDANNNLEDGSHSRFSDWKCLKSITPEDLGQITEEFRGVFSRISTAGQITESKEDLLAIEILTLILGTDDVFKGDWVPRKYKQTQGEVKIYEGHLKKLSFQEGLFPSPPMDRELLRPVSGGEGIPGKRLGEEVIPEGDGIPLEPKLSINKLK